MSYSYLVRHYTLQFLIFTLINVLNVQHSNFNVGAVNGKRNAVTQCRYRCYVTILLLLPPMFHNKNGKLYHGLRLLIEVRVVHHPWNGVFVTSLVCLHYTCRRLINKKSFHVCSCWCCRSSRYVVVRSTKYWK